jgi:transposase
MDRRAKVELFEEIRRGHAAGETIQGLATKYGIHRRMVRQAISAALPPTRKRPDRERPKIGPIKDQIEQILQLDLEAPRKQRHTAHRIWTRLRAEHPEQPVGEPTVRRYVAQRKRELGLNGREVFVPQSYEQGQEGQVDWFEAVVKLDGELRKLQFFAMRSMASGDGFHRAYTNATQQAFLEAHEHGFGYFGGVFRTLRYDNLKAAVKKILRGYQREETERVIAFRSHWGFKSEYCNPASGNEKGGVEGELGWFRRNWLVPVPEASDLASLNEKLVAACAVGRDRTINGRSITVGQAARMEQPYLLPLAEERFPIDEILYPLVVDGKGCVKVKTNWYSTPLWPGLRVTARVWPSLIEIEHDGRCVARHQRNYGKPRMEQADSCCGTGAEPWRNGLGGHHSYPADARSGTTETIRHYISGGSGAVRASATGDGRLRSAADTSLRQGGDPMKNQPERKSSTENLEHASIRQYCKAVRTPAIGANFVSLAEQAVMQILTKFTNFITPWI